MQDLNLRHLAPRASALPGCANARKIYVTARVGIEPTTNRLTADRSTAELPSNWAEVDSNH